MVYTLLRYSLHQSTTSTKEPTHAKGDSPVTLACHAERWSGTAPGRGALLATSTIGAPYLGLRQAQTVRPERGALLDAGGRPGRRLAGHRHAESPHAGVVDHAVVVRATPRTSPSPSGTISIVPGSTPFSTPWEPAPSAPGSPSWKRVGGSQRRRRAQRTPDAPRRSSRGPRRSGAKRPRRP